MSTHDEGWESRANRLEAENARLQARVEDGIAVIDVAAAKAVRLERERDGYKALAKWRGEVLADTKPGRQRWEKRRAAAIDATPEDALKREKERR